MHTPTDFGFQRASADELARLHQTSLDRLDAREATACAPDAEARRHEPDHSQEPVYGDLETCPVCYQKRYVQCRDEGRSITRAIDHCDHDRCPFIRL